MRLNLTHLQFLQYSTAYQRRFSLILEVMLSSFSDIKSIISVQSLLLVLAILCLYSYIGGYIRELYFNFCNESYCENFLPCNRNKLCNYQTFCFNLSTVFQDFVPLRFLLVGFEFNEPICFQ